MDKLLLAAFLSSLAGFITAIVSVVKLVNEKENKTSEFRQAWTNSARAVIAELAAKLTSFTADLEYQNRLVEIETKLAAKTGEANTKRLESIRETLLHTRRDISLNRHDQHQAFALCKLHFKPNDPEFIPIEHKFELIRNLNHDLFHSKESAERNEIKAKNYAYAQEIVETGRVILKKEWERVKEGEKAFKETKKYSLIGGVLMLFILLSIGLHAFFLFSKTSEAKQNNPMPTMVDSKSVDSSSCWKLQDFDRRIFKFNACTGEAIELGISPLPKSGK